MPDGRIRGVLSVVAMTVCWSTALPAQGFGAGGLPGPGEVDSKPGSPASASKEPGDFAAQAPAQPGSPAQCADGSALAAAEVEGLLRGAAGAVADPMTVAVVDRAGRPLGVYRRGVGNESDDRAVGLARTGAFFSNNQAPLSSRTVRFVSGIHFPPGIPNTPNAALYGIENTNRGCDLGVSFVPGRELPPARSVVFAGDCDAFDRSGCGTGPVTGKADVFDSDFRAVDPGGLPVFRGATLVGGIGVVTTGPGRGEFAALTGASSVPGLAPIPQPLPPPGVVFIDGVRLPFVLQTRRPAAAVAGDGAAGSVVLGPVAGGCAADGWLVAPRAGRGLSHEDVERLVEQSRQAASRTRAVIRLPLGSRARMVIAVGDLDGEILGLFRMPDATLFSVDVAVAKARNVVWFSGPGGGDLTGVPPATAISNRTISFASQPLYPPGIDGTGVGPLWDLFLQDTQLPCSQGSQTPSPRHNGIVFFPGALPLYRDGELVGGLGISGDGVEQDDYVAFLGGAGFQPPPEILADRVFVRGVRLPFLKFPRNPER